MSADGILKASKARALSSDSIRCLAHLLSRREGVRSDARATDIGRRISAGEMTEKEADWLMKNSSEINQTVWDDVEQFIK